MLNKHKITPELLEAAEKLYYEGKTYLNISKSIGISESVITKYKKIFNWKRNPGYKQSSTKKLVIEEPIIESTITKGLTKKESMIDSIHRLRFLINEGKDL